MGRGEGNHNNRITLDELMTGLRSEPPWRESTFETAEGVVITEIRDLDGALHSFDRPAQIHIKDGFRILEEWNRNGSPHRDGGLPARVKAHPQLEATARPSAQIEYLEEGALAPGPHGFSTVLNLRCLDALDQADMVKFSSPESDDGPKSPSFVRLLGRSLRLHWERDGIQYRPSLDGVSRPAELQYRHGAQLPFTVIYNEGVSKKGRSPKQGPSSIIFDDDGQIIQMHWTTLDTGILIASVRRDIEGAYTLNMGMTSYAPNILINFWNGEDVREVDLENINPELFNRDNVLAEHREMFLLNNIISQEQVSALERDAEMLKNLLPPRSKKRA